MPSIEQNQKRWSSFAWTEKGDEWSHAWGGSERLWHMTIWPRVGAFLPAETVLEIAPGHGRVTQFLLEQAGHLHIVDLVPECIESCRERFGERGNIEYHVNDGRSLPMLAAGSIGFAFSWDSLVHAERPVLASYLKELARVLTPGACAFLHHSNLRTMRHAFTGRLTVRNEHWRATSVSADIVRRDAGAAGLHCLAQETVCWGGSVLNDCFSLLRRPRPGDDEPTPLVAENRAFADEGDHARRVAALYAPKPALTPDDPGAVRQGRTEVRWGPAPPAT